jgi:hypothetical protein
LVWERASKTFFTDLKKGSLRVCPFFCGYKIKDCNLYV